MPTILDQIMARTRIRVDERKAVANLQALELQAAAHTPRGFQAGLRRAAADRPAVIAELKKASPSRGLLRAEDYRPAVFAHGYEQAGAAAISVLTDEEFFQGALDDLRAVSEVVNIPVLRKDFMLDPFQVLEARAAGADAILLIVAAHTNNGLKALNSVAREFNMDVLCEIHTRTELERAVDLGMETIGVNSRDLTTMQVNPAIHIEMARLLPANVVKVAESGVNSAEDIRRLLEVGYDAFLIGEALMRRENPAEMLAELMQQNHAAKV